MSPEPLDGLIPETSGADSANTGVPFAQMVAISATIVPVPLDELLSRAYSISVVGGGIEGVDDGNSVACGEIGGPLNDSVLRIGLRPQPNSPVLGIATLFATGEETRVIVEAALADEASGEDQLSAEVIPVPGPQNAAIHQGICASLSPDVTTELLPVQPATEAETGEGGDNPAASAGVPFAVPVLVSTTTIEGSVTQLLERASSVAVTANGLAGVEDGEVAACGEIGGPFIGGVLRIGLRQVEGSGVRGIATCYDLGEETTGVVERMVTTASEQAEPSAMPTTVPDTDGDGVLDDVDSCPSVANSDQLDSDGDGVGDACATELYDTDGDGVSDVTDNCTFVANPDQLDSNGDGIGDACPPAPVDTDGDGVPDLTDNCTFVANPDQLDSNGDGTGDACTEVPPLDSDGDEIPDGADNCPDVPNGQQFDDDGDGIGNVCDPDWPGLPTPTAGPIEPTPTEVPLPTATVEISPTATVEISPEPGLGEGEE
jgi:hypothetical protein